MVCMVKFGGLVKFLTWGTMIEHNTVRLIVSRTGDNKFDTNYEFTPVEKPSSV